MGPGLSLGVRPAGGTEIWFATEETRSTGHSYSANMPKKSDMGAVLATALGLEGWDLEVLETNVLAFQKNVLGGQVWALLCLGLFRKFHTGL